MISQGVLHSVCTVQIEVCLSKGAKLHAMSEPSNRQPMVVDFITGVKFPDVGAEANRQMVERFLVEEKGYAKADISVNAPIEFEVAAEIYCSKIDLLVSAGLNRQPTMVVKCAAGSLGSRERETLAAARLYGTYPIPISVVSDGRTAIVMDTVSGRTIGKELAAIPARIEIEAYLKQVTRQPLSRRQLEAERMIFRSYDIMNVNVVRKSRKDSGR